MSTANRGMSDIKMIREALEDLALESVYAKGVASKALAALSRLAEPGEDSQELDDIVSAIRIIEQGSGGCNDIDFDDAVALVKRYVAAQVAKAREEEREACAERAIAWQKKLCADDDWPCRTCTECDQLRAAIKEAPDA